MKGKAATINGISVKISSESPLEDQAREYWIGHPHVRKQFLSYDNSLAALSESCRIAAMASLAFEAFQMAQMFKAFQAFKASLMSAPEAAFSRRDE